MKNKPYSMSMQKFEKIKSLRKKGLKYREIAAITGFSAQGIASILKKYTNLITTKNGKYNKKHNKRKKHIIKNITS